jgi:Rieske Fe-S protein
MVLFSRNFMRVIFMVFFLSFGINGCKDDYTSVVPYIYVNFDINPTIHIELNIPGGSLYVPGWGFGGILIVRDALEGSSQYLAYDAACTHEVSSTCRVKADGSGTATCPCCGSQYILIGGGSSIVKGPATEPLKQYHAYFSGSRIQIKN